MMYIECTTINKKNDFICVVQPILCYDYINVALIQQTLKYWFCNYCLTNL